MRIQLILPWTQILCFFLDSDFDIQSARNLLQQPLRQLAIGDEPVPASMQVIIVVTKRECPDDTAAHKCADFHEFAETGGVTILDLRLRCGLSDTVAFERLRNLILEQLSVIRIQQNSTCRRFSASHLSACWKFYIQVYRRSLNAPRVDLLAQARKTIPRTNQ